MITPYWNDHSAFDAYSFLIEAEGKRIFYSGDFRGHGRKDGAYRWFLHNTPKDIDYLILEGTSVGKYNSITEYGVKEQMSKIFEHSDNGCYVWTSSQNIDRLVSIYKACLTAKKTLVLDIYTANVLNILSDYGKLPTPIKKFPNLRVLFNYRTTTKLIKTNRTDLVYPFKPYKITSAELNTSPNQFVVLVRPSLLPEIKKIAWKDGIVVYSMWEGYKTKPYSAKFLEYFSDNNFKVIDLHSSGHADEATLVEYANALNPKNIIPIHTFRKNQYQSIFSQNVMVLENNEVVIL
jgi:ribonuclease J